MGIQISGVNGVDKIVSTDGTIDVFSGTSISGVLTATSFTGNLTGNVTGNLTGNVNASSNLLLQIGGSEKFRVGSSGQLGIGGANYGTSGQVLQSAGSGAPPTWNTINTDKITEGNTEVEVVDSGSDGHFKVTTEGTERLRITSDGKIGMKTASPQKDLHVYNSSVATVRIETGASNGQAWDILSTNGASSNTGTLSIRNEAGDSFVDLASNGGAHKTVIRNGGATDLLIIDKSGNANIAGIVTATAFKGDIVPATYHGGRRNMFINGEFAVDQRGDRNPMANQNNGANGLGYGGPDHVQFLTNLGAFEAKQANSSNSPKSQAGAVTSYELDCTSASGPSTSNYTFLRFKWSGNESARLLYGTSNARPVTISFWVQCNKTGNFTATLRNESANKLISKVVTISSADTWEYKTITFVGDTASAISATLGARWMLEMWLDGGSNYTGGTLRTGWTATNNADRGAGSTLNICSSTSNYFRISLLQVEMGPYATPFEFRTYGEYLHDCEYYFQKPVKSRGSNQAFEVHIWGHKVADTYALRVQTMLRPTEMRVNPTDYYHDNNPSGLTAQRFQTQGADYEYTYNVGMNIGSNRKEFSGGTKYPYGVNGMGAGESGILWAYDFESYAEY